MAKRKTHRSHETLALFTGAGASKTFGFPLTSEIFPRIVEGVRSRTLFGNTKKDKKAAAMLWKAMQNMFPGIAATSTEALPSITDVLSLLDYSIVASRPAIREQEAPQLVELRTLLERGIVETLDWPYHAGTEPKPLVKLRQWLQSRAKARHVGIITTNYDLSIDTELLVDYDTDVSVARNFDFGFVWREAYDGRLMTRPVRPKYSLLKLHGSVNWLKCELCEHVYINTDAMVTYHAFEEPSEFNTCHCRHARLKPMLVAPSMVRDIRETNLLEVWKAAVAVLRTSDHWLIVGYSLPPEDIAIRSMLMRAYQARTKPPRVTVVVKEPGRRGSRPIENRYRLLFPDCQYFAGGLTAFINQRGLP